jgi:hypothetical protein
MKIQRPASYTPAPASVAARTLARRWQSRRTENRAVVGSGPSARPFWLACLLLPCCGLIGCANTQQKRGGGGWWWWLGRGQGVYLHCVFALRRLSRRLGRDRAREGVIQVLTADLSHRGITNDESLRVASLIIYTVWNIWMQLREAACSVGWPCDLMYLHFSMLGLL